LDKDNRGNYEAITKLSILKEIQNDLTAQAAVNNQKQTIPHVFKGDTGKCTTAFGGFSDCCKKGKGWGHSAHLAHCDGDEKILSQKREKSLCVELGPYCAEKKAGICLRKKRSFCCFPSKLARLIHEQGRRQLGMSWGKPKEPNCRGFTVDELSRLDFSKFDMSELYGEILSRLKTTPDSLVKRNLQHRVEQIASSLKNEKREGGY
jgi:conjugal transfer mating pair stabilization protein TraN